MNSHDAFKDVMKQKSILEKISPKSDELDDIEGLLEQADNPKVMVLLMYKVLQEKEKTNKLLESINDKYDKIMFELKTNNTNTPITNNTQTGTNKYEVLAEQDQLILKTIDQQGKVTAKEIKNMLNYKGLNAACQRLNKLYREGHLKKVQSGRKVLYLANS